MPHSKKVRLNRTVNATSKLTMISPAVTRNKTPRIWQAILMSVTVCFVSATVSCASSTVKVISADQSLLRLKSGETLKAPVDGWFMPDALYQRWRQMLADKLQGLSQ